MKKITKLVVIISFTLILMGLILMLASFIGGARFSDLEDILRYNRYRPFSHFLGCLAHHDESNIKYKYNYDYEYDYEYNASTKENTEFIDYAGQKLTSIDIDISAAAVYFFSGDTFSVKIQNKNRDRIQSRLDNDGTLYIDSDSKFWSAQPFKLRKGISTVFITIPKAIRLHSLEIDLNAGNISSKDLDFFTDKTEISVNSGNLDLKNLSSKSTEIDCNAGNLKITGTLTGITSIDCNAGNISLNLNGNIEDYSFDTETTLGSVKINGTKISNINKRPSSGRQKNHLDIECTVGTIDITIE